MFNWFKKKTRRPLENVRAEGLEAHLSGSSSESVQASGLLGRLCREASQEISPTGFVQVCPESFQPLSVCPCQECKLARELFPGASDTVLCQHSTRTDSPQEAPEKQTLERKMATPQGSKPLRAVDGVVRAHKPRTESRHLTSLYAKAPGYVRGFSLQNYCSHREQPEQLSK